MVPQEPHFVHGHEFRGDVHGVWGHRRRVLLRRYRHLRLVLVARRRDDLELQAALETADAQLDGLSRVVAIAAESRQVLLHDAGLAEPDAWWSTARLPGRLALRAPWPQSAADPCEDKDLQENDVP